MSIVSKNKWVSESSIIHIFFFLLFCSISILNHFFYRSSGLDYGMANQALYQYAHFKPAIISETLNWNSVSYLSCHLSFWVPILSPFYWLFGSYTLLLFQNFALIFAGIGLMRLAENFEIRKDISLFILLQFYSFFAIYSALAFDFHDNVIGACFLPWMFYFYQKNRLGLTFLCFVAILISKENMAILLGFTAFTMWVENKENSMAKLKIPLIIFVISVTWFLFSSLVIMPSISSKGTFEQLSRFSYLGSNLKEIVVYIYTHPIKMFRLFYESHIQPDSFEIVKQEFLLVLLLSGGIVLIRKPTLLWMALPILMQKLWNKELVFWGLGFHYQIELAAIVSLAIIFWIKQIENLKIQYVIVIVLFFSTFSTTIFKMNKRYSDFLPIKENVLMQAHYIAPEGFKNIQNGLKSIPVDSAVCAQANLLPHLSNRDKIYHFPFLHDARYLVVIPSQLNSYPVSNDEAILFLDSLKHSNSWTEDSTNAPLWIFIKK